jgi:biopolymer transport protein ExbD
MAHIEDGKGGKSANVELNIVPVIDLMSVLIVFLLITAVWNQISMIQLGTSVYGKKTNDQPIEPPKSIEIALKLDIQKNGFVVFIGTRSIPIPRLMDGEYDKERLKEELAKIKERYPEKEDIFVSVDDDLAYEAMVTGMDAAIGEGFPNIGVTTGSSKEGI